MNAALLQEHLIGKRDLQQQLLESLGYTCISYTGGQIRFPREPGTNPTSMSLDPNTLRFYCFSTNYKGNLFSLVMDREHCSFPKSLNYVAKVLGLSSAEFDMRIEYPFGGYYRHLIPDKEDNYNVPSIPEESLAPFTGQLSEKFFRDGIDFKTQELFQIGYDETTKRITIPERDFNGNLCGIMGRSNLVNCPHDERWFPIVPCQRSKTLFGLQQNYHRIAQQCSVVLFESEKAPMQMRSMGCRIALGLCGCHISHAQVSMLNSLKLETIVLALDEGLEEEAVREEGKKLIQNNIILKNKVGYVWDPDGEIIPKGSKANPADLGVKAYKEIMRTKVRWLS